MATLIFLRGVHGYVWANMLTSQSLWVDEIQLYQVFTVIHIYEHRFDLANILIVTQTIFYTFM